MQLNSLDYLFYHGILISPTPKLSSLILLQPRVRLDTELGWTRSVGESGLRTSRGFSSCCITSVRHVGTVKPGSCHHSGQRHMSALPPDLKKANLKEEEITPCSLYSNLAIWESPSCFLNALDPQFCASSSLGIFPGCAWRKCLFFTRGG